MFIVVIIFPVLICDVFSCEYFFTFRFYGNDEGTGLSSQNIINEFPKSQFPTRG